MVTVLQRLESSEARLIGDPIDAIAILVIVLLNAIVQMKAHIIAVAINLAQAVEPIHTALKTHQFEVK